MSGEGSADERDGLVGKLAVASELGGNGRAPGGSQETYGCVAQQSEDRGTCAAMNQTGILAEVHVLAAMGLVLNPPMLPFEGEEPMSWDQMREIAHEDRFDAKHDL